MRSRTKLFTVTAEDCTKTLEIQLIAFKTTKTNSVGTNVVSYQEEEK